MMWYGIGTRFKSKMNFYAFLPFVDSILLRNKQERKERDKLLDLNQGHCGLDSMFLVAPGPLVI